MYHISPYCLFLKKKLDLFITVRPIFFYLV